jgi:hypothetical protein
MVRGKGALALTFLFLMFIAVSGCAPDFERLRGAVRGERPGEQDEKQTVDKQTLSYRNVFGQMFPDIEFSPKDANSVVSETGETYYIEQIIYGRFVGRGPEFLAVVRRPPDELAHAQGFYNAYVGVFDAQEQTLLSPVNLFAADEGFINLFQGRTRTYVFFSGRVTFQGWTSWTGALFRATADRWTETWPRDARFWDNRAVQVGQDRLILYDVEVIPGEEVGAAPGYRFSISEQLFWNPVRETFVSR